MNSYNYAPGAIHNDNSRHITIEQISTEALLALVGIAQEKKQDTVVFADAEEVKTRKETKKSGNSGKRKPQKTEVQVSASYMTFKLDCMSETRLIAFHDYLIKHSIIGNQLADFLPLFTGQNNDCKITWTDDASRPTLVELFRTMEAHKLIEVPKGFKLIGILKAHFLDMEGQPLSGLDKGNEMHPQYQSIIDDCIRLMEGELLDKVSEPEENTRYSRFSTPGMHTRFHK